MLEPEKLDNNQFTHITFTHEHILVCTYYITVTAHDQNILALHTNSWCDKLAQTGAARVLTKLKYFKVNVFT